MMVDWRNDLFREKSLRDIYRAARPYVGRESTYFSACFVFAMYLFYILLCLFHPGDMYSPDNLVSNLRSWATVGLTFGTTVLGFLITGFSIFASVTKPRIFIILSQIPFRTSPISQLKFVFFNFIVVFIFYIALVSVCVFAEFGMGPGEPVTVVGRAIFGSGDFSKLAAGLFAGLILSLMTACVMMLRSFIWNIYQTILLVIAAEDDPRPPGLLSRRKKSR